MEELISIWRERLASALRNSSRQRLLTFIVVPTLLFLGLWLPPISLGSRISYMGYPLVAANGGTVGQEDGGQLYVPQGALSGQLRLRLKAVDVTDKQPAKGVEGAALKALPANMAVRGALYRFDAHGSQPREAIFTAPLPAGIENPDAFDVYAWTGKAWQWVPSQILADKQQLQATVTALPLLLAAVENQPSTLTVGVGAPDVGAVNAAPLDVAGELYLAGLSLDVDGKVNGEIALDSAPPDLLVLPMLSNVVNGEVHNDWVANIIANPEARAAHIQAIQEVVTQGGYKGLSLEYVGLSTDLRDPFAGFAAELAKALHKDGRVLAVRVDEPLATVDGAWDTGGYDWVALGRAVDILRIPVINEISACVPGGAMEQCLRSTIGQVNRQKIQLIVDANARELVGGQSNPLPYGDALSLASKALVAKDGTTILPGGTLSVQMANLGAGLQEDAESGHTWFAFTDEAGNEHKVWIENSTSVSRKLALAGQFGLRGVEIDNLAGTANDARIWDTVRINREASSRSYNPPSARRYSVVWKVQSQDGTVLQEGTNPGDQAQVTWTAAEDQNPGEYIISMAIAEDEGKTLLGQAGSLALIVPTPTPVPKPAQQAQPGSPSPPANTTRGVPFGYGIQVDMCSDGNYDRILGAVQQLGFGWIKQQVEWKLYNPAPGQYDWGRLDAIADACSARGIRVLFSVCKAPVWARPGDDDKGVEGPPADFGTYAEFMRQMAARYKGRVQAYEIWNEQNLWYEWGGRGGRLSAARYVQLLAGAYQAIKSVDPGAIVISGALTPTGVSDGDTAIDDQAYLRQMYAAGLRSYCDAVGAHPSGYNNPPDADWQSWSDPTTGRCKGHPSWFFRSTMEGYRNIMIQNGDAYKRIVPTEFGWASVDGLGVSPAGGYEYAADNTADEQAQFITRAYQMGRNWGFVGPMFLWNLNFCPVSGAADEKAAFGIVDSGWGPRPAFNALAGMPK